MKNLILSLLVFAHSSAGLAQFILTNPNPSTGTYSLDPVLNDPTNPMFDNGDLITWIFPDGQFRQQTVIVDQNHNVQLNTNQILWKPLVNPFPGPGNDNVFAFLAKKGGQGNPGRYAILPPNNGPLGTIPFYFNMPAPATFQLNTSWDFAKGKDIFLITSYLLYPDWCPLDPNDYIEIYYDKTQLTNNKTENLSYKNESIQVQNTTGFMKISGFTNLAYQFIPNHVFNNFTVSNNVQRGDSINIGVKYDVCNKQDSIGYSYVAKGEPHDPNRKDVDIDTICPSSASIPLTYTIRFHNDGDKPVNHVVVQDNLPAELDASTLVPNIVLGNGASYTKKQSGQMWEFEFNGLNLPGIRQTTPYVYTFDQTVYQFSFTVNTTPNITVDFDNFANVLFYSDNNPTNPLSNISTNNARVESDTFALPGCFAIVPALEVSDLINAINITPNPFSGHTDINIALNEQSKIVVDLRDLNGGIVKQLASGELSAGTHKFTWGDAGVPTGVYLLQIFTPKGRVIRKIVKI